MRSLIWLLGATALFIAKTRADEESIVHDGQLATPGLVIVNAPQPNTPLGGGNYWFPRIMIECLTKTLQTRCTFPSTSPPTVISHSISKTTALRAFTT